MLCNFYKISARVLHDFACSRFLQKPRKSAHDQRTPVPQREKWPTNGWVTDAINWKPYKTINPVSLVIIPECINISYRF